MNPVADLGTAPVVPSIEDAVSNAPVPEQGEQDAMDQILDSIEENDDDDSDDDDQDDSGLMGA